MDAGWYSRGVEWGVEWGVIKLERVDVFIVTLAPQGIENFTAKKINGDRDGRSATTVATDAGLRRLAANFSRLSTSSR